MTGLRAALAAASSRVQVVDRLDRLKVTCAAWPAVPDPAPPSAHAAQRLEGVLAVGRDTDQESGAVDQQTTPRPFHSLRQPLASSGSGSSAPM